MREAFFILLVLLGLACLTAFRYRRQLRFALEIWRTMKKVRQMQASSGMAKTEEPAAVSGDLVNCGKCGKWVPEGSAIRFGPSIVYCSTKCLQDKARV